MLPRESITSFKEAVPLTPIQTSSRAETLSTLLQPDAKVTLTGRHAKLSHPSFGKRSHLCSVKVKLLLLYGFKSTFEIEIEMIFHLVISSGQHLINFYLR